MALNTRIYYPNVSKGKTLGLSDTIRSDAYAYATLYTVTISETLVIREGIFNIVGSNTSGTVNEGMIILDITGKEIVLYSENQIGASAYINETITLSDKGVNNITLVSGDTIKIKYVHPNALGAYTANIKATLFIDDYTA
jgi:hypothetical protein